MGFLLQVSWCSAVNDMGWESASAIGVWVGEVGQRRDEHEIPSERHVGSAVERVCIPTDNTFSRSILLALVSLCPPSRMTDPISGFGIRQCLL